MAKLAATDPKLDTTPMWFMGHSERYEYALGQTSYLQSLRHRLKLSIPEMEALISSLPDYYYPSVCCLCKAHIIIRPWLTCSCWIDGGYAPAGPARTSRYFWRRCRRRRPRSSWMNGCRGSSTAASAAATPRPSWLTYVIGNSRMRFKFFCTHWLALPRPPTIERRRGAMCKRCSRRPPTFQRRTSLTCIRRASRRPNGGLVIWFVAGARAVDSEVLCTLTPS